MTNESRWEVMVRFVYIGGIADHHCLNFLFITLLIFLAENVSRLNTKCYKFYNRPPFKKPPGKLQRYDRYCFNDGSYQVCKYKKCDRNPCTSSFDCETCPGKILKHWWWTKSMNKRFVHRCLTICTFSFGHCFVCSSSIYGFWLPLWYLQTLLSEYRRGNHKWTIQSK
jgi:hypothetical protein